MADTPVVGQQFDKLFLISGQFTSTVKSSVDVTTPDSIPIGLTYDLTNTPWGGTAASKLYLQSGQHTSTTKTSEDISGVDATIEDVSWDNTNTPWTGNSANKKYLQSGQFTSTLKTSAAATAGSGVQPRGVSFDGTNTPECDNGGVLDITSGQFTTTVKDSVSVSGVDNETEGLSWDGTNTPWCGTEADKMYLQSGHLTSTLKTSEAAPTSIITGICTNDFRSRAGIGSGQQFIRR